MTTKTTFAYDGNCRLRGEKMDSVRKRLSKFFASEAAKPSGHSCRKNKQFVVI